MDWLKSDNADETKFGGTGLLLAPMNSDTQNINDGIEIQEPQLPAVIEPSIEDFIVHVRDDENEKNYESEIEFEIHELEKNEIKEPELNIENDVDKIDEAESNSKIENSSDETKFGFETENELEEAQTEPENKSEADYKPEPQSFEDFSNKISELNQSLQEIQNIFEAQPEQNNEPIDNEINENEEGWQQRATGFELNLNEPPPELWTRINAEDYGAGNENSESNENEELEYEQGMSLQGAAYVPKAPKGAPGRGQNFTERLHQTLRGRKQENKPLHPYRSKALIICSTLLMLLGVAYLALFFIQQWTPEKIYDRANSKLAIGDYEGAMNLFYRGYKRYPNVLTFLTGIAKAAESADRTQTAVAAWENYIRLLPKDDDENINSAQLELRRLKGEPEPVPEPAVPEPEPEPEEISEPPQAEEKKEEPQEPEPTSPKEKEPEPEPIPEEKTPELQEETPKLIILNSTTQL